MNLVLEPYLEQKARWPKEGQHILAQYTDDYIVVYQAYKHLGSAFGVRVKTYIHA